MPLSYGSVWQAASSPSASSLCRLLQSYPNAPVIGQGLAGVARHRAMRSHIGCANSGRIAPPIRQDLVSDRDRGRENTSIAQKRAYIDCHRPRGLSIRRGCELMNLARSTYYDEPAGQPIGEAKVVQKIGEICAEYPRYGYRRVTAQLRRDGLVVNHLAALRLAIGNRRPRPGCVHHSDRGAQYAADQYRETLAEHGLRGSMGRRGGPHDNAKA